MIISHKHKFIFIKTTKTAGTSIEVFLEKQCGENDIVTPIYPQIEGHASRNYNGFFNPIPEIINTNGRRLIQTSKELFNKKKFYNHIPAFIVRDRILTKKWNKYYKFCVERNPWEKAVSQFNMLISRGQISMSFEEYIKSKKNCLNFPKYTDPQTGKVIVDKVIRFEKLNEELNEVFKKLGIDFDGHLNEQAKTNYRKDKKHYKEYYNDELKIIVEKKYEKEIRLWNYTF